VIFDPESEGKLTKVRKAKESIRKALEKQISPPGELTQYGRPPEEDETPSFTVISVFRPVMDHRM
jgi:hypothetical protein